MPQSKKEKRKKALARLEGAAPHINQDLRIKQFPRSAEAKAAEIEILRAKTR